MSEKTKVTSLDIIIEMVNEKPYYSLKYKEVGNNYYNIGFSSYTLENVLEWKDECFELVTRNEDDNWIPVSVKMPEEHDSIYAKYKGTPKWRRYMFERNSEYALVTLKFKDGNMITFARTVDGEWKTETSFLGRAVIAWMPFPEPYVGYKNEEEKIEYRNFDGAADC